MNSPSFCMSETSIRPAFLKGIFTGHRVLGDVLLSALGRHCPLVAHSFYSHEKPVLVLIFAPLYTECAVFPFPLALFI